MTTEAWVSMIKDKLSTLIYLVEMMTQIYKTHACDIANLRIELLNYQSDPKEIQQKRKLEKKKIAETIGKYNKLLRQFSAQLPEARLLKMEISKFHLENRFANQFLMIPEKDKCFEEVGQGIIFDLNPQGVDIVITLYTIRNGERKVNIFHEQLVKSVTKYFQTLRHNHQQKSARTLIQEFQRTYFTILRKIQYNCQKCEKCEQTLKYSEKENSWVSPTCFTFEDKFRFFHEDCSQPRSP